MGFKPSEAINDVLRRSASDDSAIALETKIREECDVEIRYGYPKQPK